LKDAAKTEQVTCGEIARYVIYLVLIIFFSTSFSIWFIGGNSFLDKPDIMAGRSFPDAIICNIVAIGHLFMGILHLMHRFFCGGL